MTHRLGPPDPRVTRSDVDGSLLLLHPSDARVLMLNETASAVWDLCDGTLTLDDVVAELAQAYGATEETVRPDVVEVVARFLDEGFLPSP